MDLVTLSTSVVADRSVTFTATVIIAGLGIVLTTLAVLILVFYLFGRIMVASEKKKNASKQNKNTQPVVPVQPVVTETPVAPVVEEGISGEVVAAISAAIAASETPNTTFAIRSIKVKNVSGRNPWASAAVANNTKPF